MTFLLDVNLLLTLHDPQHPNYVLAWEWFQLNGAASFATCPMTQSGLVRLLMQGLPGLPAFERREAYDALRKLTEQSGHAFWPDLPTFLDATNALSRRMQGYRQVSDAYLLGLAMRNDGKLATLDRGIRHLAGAEYSEYVEIIERATRTQLGAN